MGGSNLDSNVDNVQSLEDSSYELIQEPDAFISDDDEVYTESLASTEENNNPDDFESVAITGSYYDETRYFQPSLNNDRTGDPKFEKKVGKVPPPGRLSSIGNDVPPDRLHYMARERDKSRCNDDAHDLLYSVKDLFLNEYRDVFESSEVENIDILVKLRVSTTHLHLKSPFRVLLFGDPPEETQRRILAKLASALAVSGDVNFRGAEATERGIRFNVIPVSGFGSQVSPEVELIQDNGINFELNKCTSLKSYQDPATGERIGFEILDDNNVTLIVPGLQASDWKKELLDANSYPDLLIFYHLHPEDYTHEPVRLPMNDDLLNVRGLAISQGLSVLDISSKLLDVSVGDQYLMPGSNLQLVFKKSLPASNLDAFPIPLSLFSNLDSTSLNHHLAYLTTRSIRMENRENHERSCSYEKSTFSKPVPVEQETKGMNNRFYRSWIFSTIGLMVRFIVYVTIPVLFFTVIYNSRGGSQIATAVNRLGYQTSPGESSGPYLSRFDEFKPLVAKLQEPKTHFPVQGILSLPTGRVLKYYEPKFDSISQGRSESQFGQGNSSNELIFRPPKRSDAWKTGQPILAEARRGTQIVRCNITKRLEGYFLVEIDQLMAFGTLNLTVWAEGAQSFRVSETIKLRRNRPRISNLIAMASEVYSEAVERLARSQTDFIFAGRRMGETSWRQIYKTSTIIHCRAKRLVDACNAPLSWSETRHRFEKSLTEVRHMVLRRQKISKIITIKGSHFRKTVIEKMFGGVRSAYSSLTAKIGPKSLPFNSIFSIREARRNAVRSWRKVVNKVGHRN